MFKKLINIKGDLFATIFSFVAQACIRLSSSLVITRILNPDAYGVLTVLLSIALVIELIADMNVTLFIVRDPDGDEPQYLNTAWTIRLCRATVNAAILFSIGPIIASSVYDAPALSAPLRVFSLWFIISALESMSFSLAIRRKRARIVMYSEFAAAAIAAAFGITYSLYSRDYWGMIYATLLGRSVITCLSYCFFRDARPRLGFDMQAAKKILGFTKFTMPSSLITLIINQFDKIVFLRLFDLTLLGVYGLAANIAGPIESLVLKISQTVLYPRCAQYFREDPASVARKYYTENTKLFVSIMLPGAVLAGSARFVITLLYPNRYAEAAMVLQAFMLRTVLQSLSSPSEDLLVATGEVQVLLVGNIYRAIWLFSVSLLGYHFGGFVGFTYGAALSPLPVLIYYFYLQHHKGLLIFRYELYRFSFVAVLAVLAYLASTALLMIWPHFSLR